MLEMQIRRVDPSGLVEPFKLARMMRVRILREGRPGDEAGHASENGSA
jgi:hypothetical protein